MQKLQTIAWVALTAALVILVFQNLAPIEIQVFFKTVTVSTSLLIAVVWLLGALTGLPLFRLVMRTVRGEKATSSPAPTTPPPAAAAPAAEPPPATPPTSGSAGTSGAEPGA